MLRNFNQIQLLLWPKNAKEDEIWKEIARNDTEMGCDGGDFRNLLQLLNFFQRKPGGTGNVQPRKSRDSE
jgi:hypothetical protein